MKKPHVHAAIIHAFADGAQIQFRRGPHEAWTDVTQPSFLPDNEYRIKPDTCVQHSRRYVYVNMAGRENVALAYKTDAKDDRFVRWLDDDWLATELEA